MSREDRQWIDELAVRRRFLDVPQTDGVIVRGGQDVSCGIGIPREAVALLGVSTKAQFRTVLCTLCTQLLFRQLGQFRIVEDQHFSRWRLRCDE